MQENFNFNPLCSIIKISIGVAQNKQFHIHVCLCFFYLVELSNPVRIFPMAPKPAANDNGPSPFLVKYGRIYFPGLLTYLIGS